MSWMTQTEAAAALGCSNRTIRRRIRAGMLKTRREGRNILVDVDTDRAVATVTQVGRQLAEVGAAAAIQKKHDADTLSTMQATFADTLAALSASRSILEKQTILTRRSARAAWTTAAILTLVIFTGGWYYATERIRHHDELHQLQTAMAAAKNDAETAMISAEVRHVGELATTQAHLESTTQALQESLTHERQRVAQLQDQATALDRTVAEQAARLEGALADRDRVAADRERLQGQLQRVTIAANFSRTLKSIWTTARSAIGQPSDPDRVRALRAELAAAQTRHLNQLEAATTQYEADLAAARARHDGQSQTLQATLAHERETVRKLEQRVDTLSDRLVTAVLERGRLQTERQQLLEELAQLQSDLHAARLAANLSQTVHGWWSFFKAALMSGPPETPPQRVSSR